LKYNVSNFGSKTTLNANRILKEICHPGMTLFLGIERIKIRTKLYKREILFKIFHYYMSYRPHLVISPHKLKIMPDKFKWISELK